MTLPIRCEEIEDSFIISHSRLFVSLISILLIISIVLCFVPVERRVALQAKSFDSPKNTSLYSPSSSYLERWLVREGESVKKGQVLLEYLKTDYYNLANDVTKSHSQSIKIYESIKRGLKKLTQYLDQENVNFNLEVHERINQLINEMNTLKSKDPMLKRYYLHAPFDGVLTSVRAGEGEYLSVKRLIAEIEPPNKQHFFSAMIPPFFYEKLKEKEGTEISLRIYSKHCHPCLTKSKLVKIESSVSSIEDLRGYYSEFTWPKNFREEKFYLELVLGYTTLWERVWYSDDDYL